MDLPGVVRIGSRQAGVYLSGPEDGETVNSLKILSDGKILVAGTIYLSAYHSAMVLGRYLSDGTLDAGFGDGGLVLEESGQAQDLAIQADGKILMVGHGFLARYLPDGSPDASFGDEGKSPVGGIGVTIQADGRLLVNGKHEVARIWDKNHTDLAVTMDAGPETAPVGSSFTFEATVSNEGEMPASEVILRDSLPYSTYGGVGFSPSQGTCRILGGILECSLGEIAPGESASVSISIRPAGTCDRLPSFSNAATVSSRDIHDTDPENNDAQASVSITYPVGWFQVSCVRPNWMSSKLLSGKGPVEMANPTIRRSLPAGGIVK